VYGSSTTTISLARCASRSRPPRELFERFEAEVNEERHQLGSDEVDGDSVYLGWLSKLAGQTARLAALLHVGAHWTGGGAGATLIDPETVNDAITLARYYREHALAAFGLMGRAACAAAGDDDRPLAFDARRRRAPGADRSRCSPRAVEGDDSRPDPVGTDAARSAWSRAPREGACRSDGRTAERARPRQSNASTMTEKHPTEPTKPPRGQGSVSSVVHCLEPRMAYSRHGGSTNSRGGKLSERRLRASIVADVQRVLERIARQAATA
jgi:Protein of unknown function (DUF3987)